MSAREICAEETKLINISSYTYLQTPGRSYVCRWQTDLFPEKVREYPQIFTADVPNVLLWSDSQQK